MVPLLAVLAALVAGLAAPARPAAADTASFTRTYAVAAPEPLERYQADRWGQAHNAYSSPAVGDVTGDGVLDLVHGAPNGYLYLYRATDGAYQRQIEVGLGTITSSPTLTDLNDDGRLDILVGLMPTDEQAAARTIGGYDGATGALLFSKKTCTFLPGKPCNVFSTMAVGDVDGDGDEDVVATSQDHYIHAWHDDGRYLPGFPVLVYDTTWSSPSVVDLDGDTTPEIVVVADLDKGSCTSNPQLGCPGDGYGSFVWVLESNGVVSDRRFIQGEITISSPAVGDIDGDGSPDIAFTSGSFFRSQPGGSGGVDRLLHVLDRDLDDLFGPVALRNASQTSPALAQVDGGGGQEIVVSDNEGWLQVYDGSGRLRWERCGRIRTNSCLTGHFGEIPSSGLDGSPVAADVDGDGTQEIVHVGEATLRVHDGVTGAVEYEHLLYGDPYPLGNQVSTPTIFSMGGQARIAFHVLWDQGPVGRDAADRDGLFLFTSAGELGRADWPAFRGDPRSRLGTQGPLPLLDVSRTPEGSFIAKAYLDFLGRPVDPEGHLAWYRFVRGTGRAPFVRSLVFAPSCDWPREVVRRLYVDILGRDPDVLGQEYWTGRVCAGMKARDVAAFIYGSPEYFADPEQGQGRALTYVIELYEDILGRNPESDAALAFWMNEVAATGTASVAGRFYQAIESRQHRVRDLYQILLDRPPDAAGSAYWANRLLTFDDLDLAISLAASTEYFTKP